MCSSNPFGVAAGTVPLAISWPRATPSTTEFNPGGVVAGTVPLATALGNRGLHQLVIAHAGRT